MTTPEIDERAAEEPREHPPLRLRSRRSILLPDLRPPTLDEIRWNSQHRRERRAEAATARSRRKTEPPPPVEEAQPQRVEETAPRVEEAPAPLPPAPPQPTLPAAVDHGEPPMPEQLEASDPVAVARAAIAPALVALDTKPERAPVRPWEPEPEPLVEETDDLDELDTGLDLDLEFRPVPALTREPRVAPAGDWWRPAPVEGEPESSAELTYPPAGMGTTPDIVAVFAEPVNAESGDDPFSDALAEVELTPWRPDAVEAFDDDVADDEDPPPPPRLVEPEPEPEPDDGGRPIVSQFLVIREPAPYAPEQVAVLDEPNVATITRLVPLPAEPADDFDLSEAIASAPALPELAPRVQPVIDPHPDEFYEPLPAVPKEWAGRPAPLYWRLLRLRYVRPNGWLRALFFEGSVAVAVVLVLSGVATVWTIVVLPIVVAIIVKANDVLTGNLRRNLRPNDEAEPPSEDYRSA